MELNFQPTRGITRAAGLLYLAIIVLGLTSELAIRGTLVTPSDVGRTIEAISAHETLYRLSFAADLLMTMADIALAAFLFFLLSIVNLPLAFMAALFRLVQAAIIAIGLLHQDAVLMMLGRDDVEHAIAMHIKLQAHGYDLALVFFGVNCLITGFLVARSGFLPPCWAFLSLRLVVYILPEAASCSLHPPIRPACNWPMSFRQSRKPHSVCGCLCAVWTLNSGTPLKEKRTSRATSNTTGP